MITFAALKFSKIMANAAFCALPGDPIVDKITQDYPLTETQGKSFYESLVASNSKFLDMDYNELRATPEFKQELAKAHNIGRTWDIGSKKLERQFYAGVEDGYINGDTGEIIATNEIIRDKLIEGWREVCENPYYADGKSHFKEVQMSDGTSRVFINIPRYNEKLDPYGRTEKFAKDNGAPDPNNIFGISMFAGQYEYLHNSKPASFTYKGKTYKSVSSAYSALATDGGKATQANIELMHDLIFEKFTQNENLKRALKQTGNKAIVFNNTKDDVWGTINYSGSNILGRILTEVRDEINEIDGNSVIGSKDEVKDIENDGDIRKAINLFSMGPGEVQEQLAGRYGESPNEMNVRTTAHDAERINNEGPVVPNAWLGKRTRALREAIGDPAKISYIVNHVCQYFTHAVTQLSTNPQAQKRYFGTRFQDTKFYGMTRDQIKQNGEAMTDLLRTIVRNFGSPKRIANAEADGNMTAVSDMTAVRDNPEAIMKMAYGYLLKYEKIRIDYNGKVEITDEEDEQSDINDNFDNDTTDMGESPDYAMDVLLIGKDETSAESKALDEVKALISGIPRLDVDGNPVQDPYGYGTPLYMDPSEVIASLYQWTQGCETKSEMFAALAKRAVSNPWLELFLDRVGYYFDETSNGWVYDTSDATAERLSTQVFVSLRMSPMNFSESFTITNPDGTVRTVIANLNNKKSIRNQVNHTLEQYSKGNAPIMRTYDKGVSEIAYNDNVMRSIAGLINSKKDGSPSTLYDMFTAASENGRFYQDKEALRACITADGENFTAIGAQSPLSQLNGILSKLGIYVSPKALYNLAMADSEAADFNNTRTALVINKASKILDKIISHHYDNGSDKSSTIYFEAAALIDPSNKYYIGYLAEDIYEIMSEFMELRAEPIVRSGGKNHAVYNYPSYTQQVIEGLTGKGKANPSKAANEYKSKHFGQYPWYRRGVKRVNGKRVTFEQRYYSDILQRAGGEIPLAHRRILSHDGVEYHEQSDLSTALQILSSFFGEGNAETAWYRLNNAADKKAFDEIRWTKHTGKDRAFIDEKCWTFAIQEINRMRSIIKCATQNNVRLKNYDPKFKDAARKSAHDAIVRKIKQHQDITLNDVIVNGNYLYRGTGMGFNLQPFLNDVIEHPDTEEKQRLANAIIDKVFNGNDKALVDGMTSSDFLNIFHQYMQELVQSEVDKFESYGLFETTTVMENIPTYINGVRAIGEDGRAATHQQQVQAYKYLHNWMRPYRTQIRQEYEAQTDDFGRPRNYFNDRRKEATTADYDQALINMMTDFVYNNYWMKIETTELFSVDPSFYKGATDFQKRNAQSIAAGMHFDKEATIFGRRVTDGINRTVTIATQKGMRAPIYDRVAAILSEDKNPFSPSSNEGKAWKARHDKKKADILAKLESIDATDGQTVTSLTGLRKKLLSRGEWSYSKDEETDNQKETMTDEAVYRRFLRGESTPEDFQHVFAEVVKPFNFGIATKHRDDGSEGGVNTPVPVQHKNSEYALTYLNAFQAKWQPDSVMAAIFKFMEDSHYTVDKNGNKTYRLDGIDAVHFDSAVKVGAFETFEITDDMSPNDVVNILKEGTYHGDGTYDNDFVQEMDFDGYVKQQITPEHFKHHAQQMGSQMRPLTIANIADSASITTRKSEKMSGRDFKQKYFELLTSKLELAVKKAHDEFAVGSKDPIAKKQALSRILDRQLSGSTRASFDQLEAIHLDNFGNFILPLEDPSHSEDLQAALLSNIRTRLYKQMMNGGPIVQTTNWGFDSDLKVQFNENGGIDYIPAIIPMTDAMRKLLTNADGSLVTDWKEVEKRLPKGMLEGIVYRIPTEGEYSIYPIRAVGFCPSGSGSSIRLPLELTTFAGFDFDIDKLFTILKDYKVERADNGGYKWSEYDSESNAEKALNNEIFDMQYAAMQTKDYFRQMCNPSSFDDLTMYSYRALLLKTGNYTVKQVRSMTSDQLQEEADKVVSYELNRMSTDIEFHRLNSAAKELIAIAAVNNIAVAFLSTISEDVPVNVNFGKEGFTFCGKEYKGYVQLDPRTNKDGDIITSVVREYIGAAADGAKEPTLGRLGITKDIINEIMTLLRTGATNEEVSIFATQPIIQRMLKMYENASNTGYANMQKIIDDLEHTIIKETGVRADQVMRAEGFTVTLDELYERLAMGDNAYADNRNKIKAVTADLTLLEIFRQLNIAAKTVRRISSYTRLNSVSSGPKRNLAVVNNQERQRNQLDEDLCNPKYKAIRFGNGKTFRDFKERLSFLFAMKEQSEGLIRDVMREYWPSYSSKAYKDAIEQLEAYRNISSDGTLSDDMSEDIHQALLNYSFSKPFYTSVTRNGVTYQSLSPALIDMDNAKVRDKYLKNFVNWYQLKLQQIAATKPKVFESEIRNNELIRQIYIMAANQTHPVESLRTSIAANDEITKQAVKTAWDSLLLSTHAEVRELGIELYKYFSLQGNGESFHPQTPTYLAPLSAKRMDSKRGAYLNDPNFFELSDTVREDDLVIQFLLNNLHKPGYARTFNYDLAVRKEAMVVTKAIEGVFDMYKDGGMVMIKPIYNNDNKSLFDSLVISTETTKHGDVINIRGLVRANDDFAYMVVPEHKGWTAKDYMEHVSLMHSVEVDSAVGTNGELNIPRLMLIPVSRLGVKNQAIEYRPGMDYTDGSVFATVEDIEKLPTGQSVDTQDVLSQYHPEIFERGGYANGRILTYEDMENAANAAGLDLSMIFNKATFNMNGDWITKTLLSKNIRATDPNVINAVLSKAGYRVFENNDSSEQEQKKAQDRQRAYQLITDELGIQGVC